MGAFTPLASSVTNNSQASAIPFTPAGGISSSNVQDAIEELDAEKEDAVAAGTTAQYWRGDKSWQTLDKTAVGLANVDNTSDANKPVSSAQQTALGLKQDTSAKDATGGYSGLTLFKINFKNALNTFTSFFTNANTAARTYTFQDRDGTISDNTDLALKAPLASPTFSGAVTLAGASPAVKAAATNAISVFELQSVTGSADINRWQWRMFDSTGTLRLQGLTDAGAGGANLIDITRTNQQIQDVKILAVGGLLVSEQGGEILIPSRKLHIEERDAVTNAVTQVARFTHSINGTPANSVGTGIELECETTAGNYEVGVTLNAVVTDVTAGSEDFNCLIKTMTAGGVAATAATFNTAAATLPGTLAVDGNVTLGNANTDAHVVNGTLQLQSYTVAALPAAGTLGRVACVSDALAPAFLTAIMGGGAVKSPVFDNGTNWVSF